MRIGMVGLARMVPADVFGRAAVYEQALASVR